MLSLSDGKELVKLARKTVENYFTVKTLEKKETKFKEKKGVFVSIHTFPNHELRGCIGYCYPYYSLGEAVQKASISAAFEDPRFPPLEQDELNKIMLEVSVLTEPKIVNVKNPKEYLKKIEIGKDGLMIEYGYLYKGLLLPQVATEYDWDCETFLEHLCMKAGLIADTWLDPKTKILKFQTQIFKEKKPNGEIIQT
jgi:uncharacterized protein (TIGR00296 family)